MRELKPQSALRDSPAVLSPLIPDSKQVHHNPFHRPTPLSARTLSPARRRTTSPPPVRCSAFPPIWLFANRWQMIEVLPPEHDELEQAFQLDRFDESLTASIQVGTRFR